MYQFSGSWDVLGPFQIGTREATWGADPLERFGGFRALEFDPETSYASSLSAAGTVKWTRCQAESVEASPRVAEVAVTVNFLVGDWHWQQSIYGWPANQFQAWIRGNLVITADAGQTLALFADNVLEFWIDDMPCFGGDFYAFRRAPLVMHLQPGTHRIDVRLVRDVRAMGGFADPGITVKLRAERSGGSLHISHDKVLVSDIVGRRLASPFASILARNDGEDFLDVNHLDCSHKEDCTVELLGERPIRLAPGQTRSIAFLLHISGTSPHTIPIAVKFSRSDRPDHSEAVNVLLTPSQRGLYDPHKVTFLHPANFVSYAVLRAPSKNALARIEPGEKLPIMLNFHGAGLDADSHQVRHMLDDLPDLRAWVLFPSGVSSWCGDDWHDWGFADVEAAIRAIPTWIEVMDWTDAIVDVNKWLVAGHSNGGQGTIFALTHHPDKIIGAAVVSAYNSIQAYVPFQFWNEADPKLTLNVQTSLNSFRHELLVENFSGIPVLQQHGSADDNVPVYQARRLHQIRQLVDETRSQGYLELPGKGHWYDGVMTTAALRDFYELALANGAPKPELPQEFAIVVANPANTSSRGGLFVDQLVKPDQLGRIDVTRNSSRQAVYLQTSNVMRFHFDRVNSLIQTETELFIDGQSVKLLWNGVSNPRSYPVSEWILFDGGNWTTTTDTSWLLDQRYGSQLGPIQSLLHTNGEFAIQYQPHSAYSMALEISRNLSQYFHANSQIHSGYQSSLPGSGNIVTVLLGPENLPHNLGNYPINFNTDREIHIRETSSQSRRYHFQKGLGLACLRPFASQRLELLLWGFDLEGLRQAARLVPVWTGMGQPDFVLLAREMAWNGAAGALGMGYFDSFWRLSSSSYLRSGRIIATSNQ